MKKLLSRVLILVLCFSLAAAMIVGCGKSGTVDSEKEDTKPQVKMKIKFGCSETGAEVKQESRIEGMLEKKLGVQLENVYLTNEPLTKLNLLLSGNDLPDYFAGQMQDVNFVRNGQAEVTVDEVKQYMPNYWKKMDVLSGGNFENVLKERYSIDGKIRTLPSAAEWAAIPLATYIRKDRLDELGVGIPTTIEEYEIALQKWLERWPDKYPLNYRGDTIWQCFSELFNAYGIALNWWQIEDGKIIYANVRQNAKKALAKAAEWYKKQYVNPEFVTYKDNAKIDPAFEQGDILIRSWMDWWRIDPENKLEEANLELTLRKTDPKADIELLPLLKTELYPNVKPTWPIWDPVGAGGSIAFGIHLEKNKDKLHKAMEVNDKLTFDEEIVTLYAFGIKGEHWDIAEDGAYKSIGKFKDSGELLLAEGIGGQSWTPLFELNGYRNKTVSPKKFKKEDAYKKFMGYDSATYRNVFSISAVAGALTDTDGQPLSFPNLGKLEIEAYMNIITGEKPIDHFDEFVEKWYSEGGEKLTEAANRLYLSQWVN